jgi:hypothetical protein
MKTKETKGWTRSERRHGKQTGQVLPLKRDGHTPGRWQVVWPLRNVETAEIRTVANEQTGHAATLGVSYDDRTTLANARLIAAAPTMMEALEEIANRGPVEGYESVAALRLRLVATQSIARAAMAKARGEQ